LLFFVSFVTAWFLIPFALQFSISLSMLTTLIFPRKATQLNSIVQQPSCSALKS
jgi:hypothetical protein